MDYIVFDFVFHKGDFILLFIVSLACTSSSIEKEEIEKEEIASTEAVRKPVVQSLSFPVHFLVEEIGGTMVDSECVLPIGQDPLSWNPQSDVITRLQEADLIVANGAGFEAWTKTASLPVSKMLYTADGLNLIEQKQKTHSHGKGGEHSHSEIDPHSWGDPAIYLQQAEKVHEALQRISPENKDAFQKNMDTLQEKLEALGHQYETSLKPLQGIEISANHPSYAYLARAFELNIHSFDLDPEKVPDSRALAKFSIWSNGMKKPVLLWEAEPAKNVKAVFPEYAIQMYIDPLEQPAEGAEYNYLDQAEKNLERFGDIVQQLQGSNAQ